MKNPIISCLFLFSVLFTSCDKALEFQPSEALPTQEALSDIPSLQTALSGAYNGLQSSDYYGQKFLLITELEANLVYMYLAGGNAFLDHFYTYQMTASIGPHYVWNRCYNTILKVNNIINHIDEVDGLVAEKNQIKGEALSIRALAYFDLVRFFARQYTYDDPDTELGVPIVLEAGIFEPARNTVAEVYDQIVSDLVTAGSLMTPQVTKYRFSPDAADALLARVSLYMGDWPKAESLAGSLIGSGRYSLATDVVELFEGPGSPEEIFTLRFEVSEDRGPENLGFDYHPAGSGDIAVSSDLIDLYQTGDTRLDFIYQQGDIYYQSKFLKQDEVPGLHSPKLLRLAEMYLIRAEARMRNANIPGAMDDLNVLRETRGASKLTGMSLDIIDILHERHRELAFEGHTLFDYWRTKTNMMREQCSPSLELIDVCEILFDDYRTVQPIPQQEMDANPNMVQNRGYEL